MSRVTRPNLMFLTAKRHSAYVIHTSKLSGHKSTQTLVNFSAYSKYSSLMRHLAC